MSTALTRMKTGYTKGGRGLGMAFIGRFGSLPFTPNQVTVAGLALNVATAVLVYEEHFVWAFVAFIVGTIFDILDGALARSHGKLTPFGGFLDSTTDRISEGLILGAIALVLSDQGHDGRWPACFVALVGSFLVSYTRAKAEALGLRGEAGLMARTERVVLVAVVLPFAGHGSLPYGMYLLAVLTAFTVFQRVVYVRSTTSLGGMGMADAASSNGHKKPNGKVRVAIVGAGDCASALVQGVHHCRDAKPASWSRSHARRPRRVPHLRHRVHSRLRRRRGQGRARPRRGDLPRPEQHHEVRQGPELNVPCTAA